MKKTLIPLFLALVLLALSACGGGAAVPGSSAPADTAQTAEPMGEPLTFATVDLEGNAVDQSIFAEGSLTMLNIWGTFCGPCINEMPELAQLAEDYADKGLRIVGLVVDVADPDSAGDAWGIIAETGADYLHLLPSDDLNNAFLAKVNAVPTTLFFDSEGCRLGEEYVGSKSYDGWAAVIDGMLGSTGGESTIETGG